MIGRVSGSSGMMMEQGEEHKGKKEIIKALRIESIGP